MALTNYQIRHPDYAQMQIQGALRQVGINPKSFHWAVFERFEPDMWAQALWVHWIGEGGAKHKMMLPSTDEEWTAFISAIKLTI